MTIQGRRVVFDKTRGHCHFCGDKVVLGHYGKATNARREYHRGAWELDHVIQKKKGGASNPDNYLPACGKCNHLRWHRRGRDLRRLILLGLVAQDEIKAGTELGRDITAKLKRREAENRLRRGKTRDFRGHSKRLLTRAGAMCIRVRRRQRCKESAVSS